MLKLVLRLVQMLVIVVGLMLASYMLLRMVINCEYDNNSLHCYNNSWG